MACLKNNGAQVLRIKGDRFMSNGAVLRPRPNGGFRKVGKIKAGLTFQDVVDRFTARGVAVDVLAREWLQLQPAPCRRIMVKAPASARQERWVVRRDPGFLRARIAAEKTKPAFQDDEE